jgi:hypothetical protein
MIVCCVPFDDPTDVDVIIELTWYRSKVLQATSDRVFIHFEGDMHGIALLFVSRRLLTRLSYIIGWNAKYDEWIPRDSLRLLPFTTVGVEHSKCRPVGHNPYERASSWTLHWCTTKRPEFAEALMDGYNGWSLAYKRWYQLLQSSIEMVSQPLSRIDSLMRLIAVYFGHDTNS